MSEQRQSSAERVAISAVNKFQIASYTVINFFGKHIVAGFFDDLLDMGSAALLAVLSVVLFLGAAWLFAGGVSVFVKALLFRVDMVDGFSEAIVRGVACIVLSIFAKGALRLSHKVLAATEEGDDSN